MKALNGWNQNSSSGDIELISGVWLSTAAVTSITYTNPNAFTGTISLYGVS